MAFFKGLSLQIIKLIVFGVALASPGQAAGPGAVDVLGWPVPRLDQDAPDLELGDDPVSGRQLCPALTRLNLATRRSEALVLKRMAEEFRNEERGSLWRLELRSGIFWWSGEPVTSEDIAQFVRKALPDVVARRGAGLWALPDFEVKADGPSDVVIRWKKLPVFGPFVMNDAPLYRSRTSDGMRYECAGLYRPEAEGYGVALRPTPGYKGSKLLPEIRIYRAGSRPVRSAEKTFELRYASGVSGQQMERRASEASCKQSLQMPFATMVVWNTHRAPTSDKNFRQLLTQLIPRGPLANAGAADMAEVAAGPVPRVHPGFNGQVRIRPFNIRAVSEGLSRLGFKRKTASSPRVDAKGKAVDLVLLTQTNSPGLAEKVIADAFSAVGLGVTFKTKLAAGETADGVLAAFALDWPRVSFLSNFHSGVTNTAPFWSLGDKDLDQLLEAYARSLTQETPDFSLLGKIHAHLAELEPVTVLLQHKACVVSSAGLKLAKGLNQNDPDWFRQLLF